MKIWYVSQYFPPEMGAPAARVSELSRHWAEAGHDVTVLTGFPNHPTGVVPDEFRRALWRLVRRETWHGVRLVRTWLWPLPNRKSHERIRNYSSFSLSASVTGTLLRGRPDVIIATSPQLLVGLTGWWLSRIKRVPFIFEVRDLWPESLEAVGVAGERSTMVRVLGKIAGFLYRQATQIVVVSPAFRERLVEDWQVPPEKISVVLNGVEADLFTPAAADRDVRTQLNLNDELLVSYIGTMGNAHGLEMLLDAAAQLRSVGPPVTFLLVGEGAEKESLVRKAAERGLKNVLFLPQQTRERVAALLASSDICVVLLKDTPVFRTVIPTKMLEMMSSGCPVILGVHGQAASILNDAKAGMVIQPGSLPQLVAAVQTLAGNERLRRDYGSSGRKYVVEKMSRAASARQYVETLAQVTSARVPGK